MARFTFYTHPMSRGQIARWALHEASADYDPVIVEYGPRDQKFLDINPLGKLPTIVDHGNGDAAVSEAAAICHYLAEMYPEHGLLPLPEEKPHYFRWLFFAAGPVEAAVTARSQGWEVPEDKQAMVGFGSFERVNEALDLWFRTHAYVCGDRFTMADVYVGSQIDWGLAFGSLEKRDSFEAYAERLRARDAYKAAKAIDNALIAEREAASAGS